MRYGTKYEVQVTRYKVVPRKFVPRTSYFVSLYLVLRNLYLIPCTSYFVPRTFLILTLALITHASLSQSNFQQAKDNSVASDPAKDFLNPPERARPGVLWMWMGSNVSKTGITRDLEALKEQGFNRTTMFSLADITTPWAGEIGKSPTPEFISWTEPWWKLVRHAAEESKRLGMDFGMFNGPSYESSGGTWITPELSMQEICWSQKKVAGNVPIHVTLNQPHVDLHANMPYPVYNAETGIVEKPEMEARKTYYKEIAVVALPAYGVVQKKDVIDLTDKMKPDGQLEWNAPAGDWIIYRFGHTTTGALIQPAQWKATGLECDKMSAVAVNFHIDHVIGEIQKHLGDLIGTGFTHVHFDSYEAGDPSWTPKMREEFTARRGYDLVPYLAAFASRQINSKEETEKFKEDFRSTIKDLYRDVYFKTISERLKTAKLTFLCEPYGGPWRQNDVMPLVHNVMTEFWTHGGIYSPYELDATVAALRKSGQNIIEAEAFTGDPKDSKWDETPAWLKPIGDAAFCAGVNRMILHRFVQQPWSDQYRPGATMGQWGTHFDRTQTWWKPAKAMIEYWKRCQALLQWGHIAMPDQKDFSVTLTDGKAQIKNIHRNQGNTHIYFIANTAREKGSAACVFNVLGMQPELWDPVTGVMRNLLQFDERDGKISIPLQFDEAQSFFIVFRNKIKSKSGVEAKSNFPSLVEAQTLTGTWQVNFDSVWGGPAKPITFATLQDWTEHAEAGIKYYSGTATYKKLFDVTPSIITDKQSITYLDLGVVKHIAHVTLNNKDLGIVWTAPRHIKLPSGILKNKNNELIIEVTNVWANRLIGDEQEPTDCKWLPGHFGGAFLQEFPDWFLKKESRPSKNRYCFTTWNYFTKDSPLVPSGLLGPVQLMVQK